MRLSLEHATLLIGEVHVKDIRVSESSEELRAELVRAQDAHRQDPTLFSEPVRVAIRDVLRVGGYKPTGRGKPASEFLHARALGAGLPNINNLVDINNLVSLRSAHPISVLDADLLGTEPSVRFGRKDESYVFNPSGQSMDIAGLCVVCRGAAQEAVGNPVKDSMHCKVHEGTQSALYVVYGSRLLAPERMRECLDDLSEQLVRHMGASEIRTQISGS